MVVVTHQAEKIWTYDRTTVRPYERQLQGATFNMRGQLYRGHANATASSSSPVVNALGSESDDPGSGPSRGKALCPWDVREKKKRAPLRSNILNSLQRFENNPLRFEIMRNLIRVVEFYT